MSRTRRVLVNERCNQHCSFCTARRPADRAAVLTTAAASIDDALAESAEEIVLTGGEPTMRRDIAALVERGGPARVVLETNAALIDAEGARRLKEAGLDVARVHFPGWGEACDAITRDPGGFDATLRGVAALKAAGIRVEASVPITRSTVAGFEVLTQYLSTVAESVLLVPVLFSADASELMGAAEIAQAIETFVTHSPALPTRIDPGSLVPPCVFPRPARMAALYALTPGGATRDGYAQTNACSECSARESCPGVPDALEYQPRPIKSENVRRRLSLIDDTSAQIERELVQDDVFRDEKGVAHPARIVRVRFGCNQRCDFCFVSTHLPEVQKERIEAAIDDAAKEGRIVVLSGGEPTLSPYLEAYAQRARDGGASHVDLQTNATNIDAAAAARYAAAGIDWAFVSLHAPSADASDAITGAPGTFARSVRGIDALIGAGILVRLNYVLHRANAALFPAHVDWVHERFPGGVLVPSFVAPSTDLVPRHLVPRYQEVLPHLAEGLRRARRHRLRVMGLDSLCGVPLCLIPDSYAQDLASLASAPEELAAGEMRYPAPCASCTARRRCFGLRRTYEELYGHDELRPFTS